jgi:hypothetical protein
MRCHLFDIFGDMFEDRLTTTMQKRPVEILPKQLTDKKKKSD